MAHSGTSQASLISNEILKKLYLLGVTYILNHQLMASIRYPDEVLIG